jgi:hypothetical protein
MRTVLLLVGLGLAAARVASGATTIYIQNNTPFEFGLDVRQTGAPLASDQWQRGDASLAPGRRSAVLRFNRDSGITSGERFYFTTRVTRGGTEVRLLQQLLGQTINSHMWHSLSGPGFTHPWIDDRGMHGTNVAFDGVPMRVMYRAYFTGTDDDIEYILQYDYPQPEASANSFSVLAYNIFMRPTGLFKNGQAIRTGLLPAALKGYDAIVFSEAADDDIRARLLQLLHAEYPNATRIVGQDSGVKQDGGVIIVSRWPIEYERQKTFGSVCSGTDCGGDKGVNYARILKNGRRYHVFGSHTQATGAPDEVKVRKLAGEADPIANDRASRAQQFRIIKQFIDEQQISADEPVFIAGDLNVDRLSAPAEYQQMLQILAAQHPEPSGFPYSWDQTTNTMLAGPAAEYLDYVLWSTQHRHPTTSSNEVRLLRTAQDWKEFGWEKSMWDLSDHYPVHGYFLFEQLIGQFPTWTVDSQYLYVVRASGALQHYMHEIKRDSTRPPRNPAFTTRAKAGAAVMVRQPQSRPSGASGGLVALDPNLRAKATTVTPSSSAYLTSVSKAVEEMTVQPVYLPGPPWFSHRLHGPMAMGNGWQNFRQIIPGTYVHRPGSPPQFSILGLTQSGQFKWYQHQRTSDNGATAAWRGPVDIPASWNWNDYARLFGGGDGVIYGISPQGALAWHRLDESTSPARWLGPMVVANGWGNLLHAFSGGSLTDGTGVLYAVTSDGRLHWHLHPGLLTGAPGISKQAVVSSGWENYSKVFSPGDGHIYALNQAGTLVWTKHEGLGTGAPDWREAVPVSSGMQDAMQLLPLLWGKPSYPVVK